MSPTEGAAMDNPAAIELAGLTKRYRRGKDLLEAVRDVTLSVPAGQVIGLLGPNGAGKTTIIKMICGLILPSAGTIRLNRYDVARQRAAAVRQIGAVLEGSRNVYWPLSAWQNLLYFGRLKGLRSAEIRPRAERLLRDLALWDRRNDQVGGFSRGMQQKVAVAAALVTGPQVVLLDEPTIGLDVEAARTVRQWVVRLAQREGKTIVLTTHQLAMAEELCDRVAIIREGRIVTDLPTRELLDRFVEDRFEVEAGVGSTDATLADALPVNAAVESADGHAIITLPTADQETLHQLLARLHAGTVPVLGVRRVRPSLEAVFVKLVEGE